MEDNFIFKGGKHSGKSYGLIRKIDPGYILWCEQNAPGMLKEKNKQKAKTVKPTIKKEPSEEGEYKKNSLKPNINFLNEGPNPQLKSEDSNQ